MKTQPCRRKVCSSAPWEERGMPWPQLGWVGKRDMTQLQTSHTKGRSITWPQPGWGEGSGAWHSLIEGEGKEGMDWLQTRCPGGGCSLVPTQEGRGWGQFPIWPCEWKAMAQLHPAHGAWDFGSRSGGSTATASASAKFTDS